MFVQLASLYLSIIFYSLASFCGYILPSLFLFAPIILIPLMDLSASWVGLGLLTLKLTFFDHYTRGPFQDVPYDLISGMYQHHCFIIGIGPIISKEIEFIYQSGRFDRMYVYI